MPHDRARRGVEVSSAAMENDDAKRLILARRARFIAGALAGVAVACTSSTDTTKPQVCLEPAFDGGADDGGNPQPCLSQYIPPDAGGDADAAGPQPCLTPINPDAGDGG